MPSHVIVIFDRSGSMSRPFSSPASPPPIRGRAATHDTKIEEAKAQLLSWLASCTHEKVTIIPFSTTTGTAVTFALPRELSNVQAFIQTIEAGGNTVLAPALEEAIIKGCGHSGDWYVKILLITDGLSETIDEDMRLVHRMPSRLGIDAILIDPTDEGEKHIRVLCVRGHFDRVYGAPELADAVTRRERQYAMRIELFHTAGRAATAAAELRRSVLISAQMAASRGLPPGSRAMALRPPVADTLIKLEERAKKLLSLIEAAPESDNRNLGREVEQLSIELSEASMEARKVISEADSINREPMFMTSVAYPKLFPKGYSSKVLVNIFQKQEETKVRTSIVSEFINKTWRQKVAESNTTSGARIVIELASDNLEFSQKREYTISNHGLSAKFVGRPKNDSKLGVHVAILTVSLIDGTTVDQLFFEPEIIDYAVDHVSRPAIGRATTSIASIVAAGSVGLVFFGKIDQAFGVAAGTFAGMLVAVAQGWLYYLSRHVWVGLPSKLLLK
jgi:hypothetical protein